MDYRIRNKDVLSSFVPSLFLCYLFGRSHPSHSCHQWIWGIRGVGLGGLCYYWKRRGSEDTVIYCFNKTEPVALRWCWKPTDLQFCWKGTKSQMWNSQTATKCVMFCTATWSQKGWANSKTAIDPTSARSVTVDDSVRDLFNCLKVDFYVAWIALNIRDICMGLSDTGNTPLHNSDKIPRIPPRTINASN